MDSRRGFDGSAFPADNDPSPGPRRLRLRADRLDLEPWAWGYFSVHPAPFFCFLGFFFFLLARGCQSVILHTFMLAA